jgi:hypothetical protein
MLIERSALRKGKMKTTKITIFSTLVIASLTLIFSACSKAANTTVNNSTVTTANKSNTAVVVNSNQTVVSNTANVSKSAPTPEGESEASEVEGELQVGKTESVILYVGMESGDYAGYCFTNDSDAGRAILAACKNGEQCAVKGTVDHESECKVPGLEATLSDSGKITKVESAKSLGRKK